MSEPQDEKSPPPVGTGTASGTGDGLSRTYQALPVPTSTKPAVPSWITDTLHKAEQDTRTRPWQSTFGSEIGWRFDAGEDLVTVERSVGSDPSCPFNTQGSSLAA